ncbi:MAG: methyl-accepting chemotaxis protein, partial [Pseudomonadota bacterium]
IKGLILSSNEQIDEGVKLVNQTGEALGEIVEAITEASTMVNEIAAASNDQALGIQDINRSIGKMDEMTQQNSALVEESTSAAQALKDQAEKLKRLMAYFEVDGSMKGSRPRIDSQVREMSAADA